MEQKSLDGDKIQFNLHELQTALKVIYIQNYILNNATAKTLQCQVSFL